MLYLRLPPHRGFRCRNPGRSFPAPENWASNLFRRRSGDCTSPRRMLITQSLRISIRLYLLRSFESYRRRRLRIAFRPPSPPQARIEISAALWGEGSTTVHFGSIAGTK